MDHPLQVGVIGLRRRWHRYYKPALAALQRQYRIRFVCDTVHQRALREAQRVGAEAVLGPMEMFEQSVDALVLPDRQWYGLWPIEMACRAGKPVLCGMSLEGDDAHADAVYKAVRERQLPVLMAMGLRFAPVLAPLRQLLDGEMRLRLLLCDVTLPERTGALSRPSGIGTVVDLGASLVDGEPSRVEATGGEAEGACGIALHYPNGRAVGIRWFRTRVARPVLQLKLVAENGYVEARLPRRMAWTDATGRHVLTTPVAPPLTHRLLERFARVVRREEPPVPSLTDAYHVLGWLREAAHAT